MTIPIQEPREPGKAWPPRLFMDEYYSRKPCRLAERFEDTWCPEYEPSGTKIVEYISKSEHEHEMLRQRERLLTNARADLAQANFEKAAALKQRENEAYMATLRVAETLTREEFLNYMRRVVEQARAAREAQDGK